MLAESYRYSHVSSEKLFFGIVDFDDDPEIFQTVRHTLAIDSSEDAIHGLLSDEIEYGSSLYAFSGQGKAEKG